jgi:hypothetical protein
MDKRRLSAALMVVAILVSFLSYSSVVAQEPTTRVYLPLMMHLSRPPTSNQLIDQALARGEIDSETALTYKVFAAFNDPRLPAIYRGDDQSVIDSHILDEVQYRYAGLSAATQDILNPFLIPPAYVGSWVEPRPAAAGNAVQATSTPASQPPPCDELALFDWTYKDGAHVRVWFRLARPEDAARADAFIASLDGTIWPALTGLMRHNPLPDGMVSCSGGSDKLDIYLEPSVARSNAPSHIPPGCKQTPSYIMLNPGESNSTLAHEFMHAIQWSYKTSASCMYPGEYAWLAEATAEWAEDYVYPLVNEEQKAAERFFRRTPEPYLELKNDLHEYGAYIFFLYLVRSLKDPPLVKRVWDNTVGMDSLEAVNQAIPGGFQTWWPKFARDNVDKPPFDLYQKEDGLTVRPIAFDGDNITNGAATWPMSADVPHLGLVYQRFLFSGENARLVTFFNGFTKQLGEEPLDDWVGITWVEDGSQKFTFSDAPADRIKGAKVQAVFKIEGDNQWKWEDWTDKKWVSFCRDVKAERLEELVIVMSDSEYQDRGYWVRPLDHKPTVMVSDMGCWRYKGGVSVELSATGGGNSFADSQWVDNLVFERVDAHPNIPYPFQTLYVQGGLWHRAITMMGECTANFRADKTVGGVLNWDKSLWTITGATSGPSVRRYLGYATANQNADVYVSCPDGSGIRTFPDEPYFDLSGKLTAFGKVFNVAVGGAMNETVTIIDADGGKWEFEWGLIPQREP